MMPFGVPAGVWLHVSVPVPAAVVALVASYATVMSVQFHGGADSPVVDEFPMPCKRLENDVVVRQDVDAFLDGPIDFEDDILRELRMILLPGRWIDRGITTPAVFHIGKQAARRHGPISPHAKKQSHPALVPSTHSTRRCLSTRSRPYRR